MKTDNKQTKNDPIIIIARKEISDAFRNRLFFAALIMLISLSLVAISLGAITVHKHVLQYNQSVKILKDLGRHDIPPMPSLNPLAVSKNFINYLAMVGAFLAIILGFSSIRKERQAGTLELILSRPVYRDQVLIGKISGNAVLMALLMLSVGIATWLTLMFMGGVNLTSGETIKLLLTMGMSWLYLMIFFLLALFFSLWKSNGSQALLFTVIVWLVFAFILPQIGDTMDLDNQLPGGFFSSLGLDKSGETTALAKFHRYELIRGGLEDLSPTKHYERVSFALLGIKAQFIHNTWQEILQLKMVDLAGLLVPIVLLMSLSFIVFLKRET
jgi:ABC-2 type transport system permease protein